MASCKSVATTVVVAIIALPFLLVVMALVVVYIVTLVGPLYHLYRRRQESALLRDAVSQRHSDLHFLTTPRGRVCYRWTRAGQLGRSQQRRGADNERQPLLPTSSSPAESVRVAGWAAAQSNGVSRFPVVLPGGLGSTLLATSFVHDQFVQLGFDVLSFDRLGVGFSDDLTSQQRGAPLEQQVEQHIRDMHALVQHVAADAKWIVVGGSFGSTVGQLFAARYPERVAGFVNWDGLPSGLSSAPGTRDAFASVARLYALEAKFMSIGLFRLGIWLASRHYDLPSVFQRSDYTFDEVYAQINGARLLDTIANEAPLMMACCDLLTEQWAAVSYTRLSAAFAQELNDLPPHVVVPGDGSSDQGIVYAAAQQTDLWQRLRAVLIDTADQAQPHTPLLRLWQSLPVRSISNRNYDFDKAEMFMTPEMKRHYAVEHSLLCLFARDGKRIVFPDLSHAGSLREAAHLNAALLEIATLAEAWSNEQQQPAAVLPVDIDVDDD